MINNEAVSSFGSNQGWNIFEIKQWKVFLSAIVPKGKQHPHESGVLWLSYDYWINFTVATQNT